MNTGLKKKINKDISALLELPEFPCQLNDFGSLDINICGNIYIFNTEMKKYEKDFVFDEVLKQNMENNKDEEFESLIEGQYYQDTIDINMRVFYVLTTHKIMIYQIITEHSVKLLKIIDLNSLESIYIYGKELIFMKIAGGGKIREKIEIKIGYIEGGFNILKSSSGTKSNTLNDLNRLNELQMADLEGDQEMQINKKIKEATFIKNAFLFAVSIWRMFFMLKNQFLRIMKINDKKILDVALDNNYLFNIYKNLMDDKQYAINSTIQGIKKAKKDKERDEKKEQEAIIKEKEKKRSRSDLDSSYLDKSVVIEQPQQNIEAKIFDENKNKKFDGVSFVLTKEETIRQFEYGKHDYQYQKCLLKIIDGYLLIYDFFNQHMIYIEMESIYNIYVNDNRFIMIIYYHSANSEQNDHREKREKVVLFNNSNTDNDYDYFRPFMITILELWRYIIYLFNKFRLKIYEKSLKKCQSGHSKWVLNHITDSILMTSIIKNNKLLKNNHKLTANLKKFAFVDKKWCCQKKLTYKNKTFSSAEASDFLRNLHIKPKDEVKETCVIL